MEVTLFSRAGKPALANCKSDQPSGRDLAQEAIQHLLEHEELFIQSVQKGLASLDRGEFITHEDVERRIAEILSSLEQWKSDGRRRRPMI